MTEDAGAGEGTVIREEPVKSRTWESYAATEVGLPPRPFMYTLDQVADLAGLSLARVRANHVYYLGRSAGFAKQDLMKAVNVAPLGKRPDYRVPEPELLRWLRIRGVHVYERTRTVVEMRPDGEP